MRKVVLGLLLLVCPLTAHALTIVKAGPVGEIAQIAEANEIRVIFSEPMVVVGKIPKTLTVPWFHIEPELRGTFRWSGTTTLIFTPDPKVPLRYATKYDVTIDASAKSVAGHALGKPYRFSFTTPTIQLLSTDWYRKDGKATGAILIALRFNQPVDAATLAPHIQLQTQAHEFKPPTPPVKSDPAFDAKLTKAQQAAASDHQPVLSFFTSEWDKKKWPAKPEQVVLETKPGIVPDTWLQVFLDEKLAKSGRVQTGRAQSYTIQLGQTFFVEKIDCIQACNPDTYNPITLRSSVTFENMKKATSVVDVTDPAHEVPVEPEGEGEVPDWRQTSDSFSLDEMGYSLTPAHTYRVTVAPSLEAADGQRLGYSWNAVVEYFHKVAFISFGDGHGVWESSGGPVLPFHARNFQNVQQWVTPVALDQTMPTILALQASGFQKTPDNAGVQRKLAPVPDKTQSYGLNLQSALNRGGNGIVWAAIQPGDPIPRASRYKDDTTATLVQVTNLGLSVKDSPQNTLIFVTRLDNAQPVAGANVAIRTTDNKVVWTGTTDEHGIATAPNTNLRIEKKPKEKPTDEDQEYSSWDALGKLHFIVTAEKDGDVAYCASDWNDGIQPWDFGNDYDLSESEPLLRGTLFTDRGVYKPGEEVHAKAVVRSDTPTGMQLLPAGTAVDITVRDSRDKEIDKRTLKLNEWSSTEWTFSIAQDVALGTWTIEARVGGQRLHPVGEFLVAAYRRPEFRVDVSLTAPTSIAGANLDGVVTGRYLFGSPMSSRDVKWTYSKWPIFDVPPAITNRWQDDQWTFLGEDYQSSRSMQTVSTKEQKLDAKGELKLSLPTELAAGFPWRYELEGDVTDVSRQHIANRASFRVDPMPWYVGIKTPPYFADAAKGIDTAFIAAQLDGSLHAGATIEVELHRIQWNSVRQATGNGFYNWESERKEVPAGKWTVTTESQPAALHVPLGDGGEYVLIAKSSDGEGRSTTSRAWFYAVGGGYTAWERYDHNRIDLIPEKKSLKPGDVARIMIKSPWEHATALLTTEREGVRTWKTFEITSTQPTITVPVTEKDIPNLFISVVLVKGRTKEGIEDEADPGKPAFRVGYTSIDIEDATKRLAVHVKANREEYRPATKARVDVEVKDAAGKPAPSEVTLWAVDYGVLSLTGYKTPDVLASIYLKKSLQVSTEDSRQKIVSRRVLTPKGETTGGGGGRDAGPGTLRKDFRVLAFWVGSITTDRNGRAHTEITLPESLTTYRIMAVAGDRQSRFGGGDSEIRINKPVMLTQTFPRFLAVGDKATFGAVVHSQLKQGGRATVTIKSLDPSIIEFGATKTTIDVPPNGNVEARFDATAKAAGTARIQVSVNLNRESDAFEDTIPVRILTPREVVAAYGEANPTAKETLEIPKDVQPSAGGLHLELASTAMVGLSEGAQYLVDYPYGCAEQRSSAAMALMLASDLGDAFKLPGIDAKQAHVTAQKTIYELYKFQCGDGGFAFWAGECSSESPYLTSNVLHILQRGKKLGYDVSGQVTKNAADYLDTQLKQKRPENEGWWPAYTAWQAFAVKVLAEDGRNEDSNITRLYSYADRMPIFGLAYLADAMVARGERGQRFDDLIRRIDNSILPEGATAHVEELADPYLLWFWNSNVRSTAIALGTLTRSGAQNVTPMVRWLMQVRRKGRWGNTQENVWAMESLVDYYRRFEKEPPDFTAVVTLGNETLARDAFQGRSTEAKTHDTPMQSLLAKPSGEVTFERQGTGNLFYTMRLSYVPLGLTHDAIDRGFSIERKYSQPAFKAGDLVKVTLRIRNTKERRFVAVSDPIPAGTEPVESWFATTASDLTEQQRNEESQNGDWMAWWRHGGFDHIERHDDRVLLFATRLGEGVHEFSYMLRATTSGTFVTAPASAEEMYEPEVFGRTPSVVVEVK